MSGVILSSSDHWATPWWLVRCVATRWFGGEMPSVDLCAVESTRKAPRYFGPDHPVAARRCGLEGWLDAYDRRSWVWCNPPYSRPAPWIVRCAELRAQLRVPVVSLVQVAPSTRAWRAVWQHAHRVGFLDHRVRFVDDEGVVHGTGRRDVCVVVWMPGPRGPIDEPRCSLLDTTSWR